jgi:hypothetical protein
MSFLGGLVSDIAGPLVGGLLGSSSAKATNAANAKAAEDANMFTKEQLQNRHQWEVSDLKAAGLNPVLSAGGTPSIGSSAKADVINPMDSVEKGVSSALAVKQMRSQLANLKADTQKKISEQETTDTTGALNVLNYKILRQQAPFLVATAKSNAQSAAANAFSNFNNAKFEATLGKTYPMTNFAARIAHQILGSASSAKSLAK